MSLQSAELILIVDDQIDNLRLLSDMLKYDYRIRVAINGEEALKLAVIDPLPDLILLDIMMPGMDGYTVCKHLKLNVKTRSIPVIFITARTHIEDEALGFDAGAVDYVTKPVHPLLLLARVRSQIALAVQLRHSLKDINAKQQQIVHIKHERDDYAALATRLEQEISEHKRTEMALRESQARFTRIAHGLRKHIAFFTHSLEGELLYCSAYPEHNVLSVTKDMSRQQWSEFVNWTPDSLARASEEDRKLIAGEKSTAEFEMSFQTSNGTMHHVLVHEYLVEDSKQEEKVFEGMVIDITARKELEQIKEDVEHIMRHDLKTPLNGIVTLPDILLYDTNLTDEQRHLLTLIRESGIKMLKMVELSLDLFKMEAGQYVYKPCSLDLLAQLSHLASILEQRNNIKSVGVKILFDGRGLKSGETLAIEADEGLLFAVLSNLFINAVEASPQQETVCIAVSSGSPIIVSIENKGCVPAALREHFFEKYKTYGKSGGTGLGTYSAKLMAETMGFSIGMETSTEEDMTRVWLSIPQT